jgi:outer membrane receptor for ferrienterochelin and colicin
MRMKKITIQLIFIIILCIATPTIKAQADTTRLQEMSREDILKLTTDELLDLPLEYLMILANKLGVSIDELLKMKTSVASKTELTPRETPGIVSIITEEEIINSGARDLIDVLRLVPGFHFGYDVEGIVGLQIRGNWAHEGKILLLVDGQEYNELAYNTLQFGNHYSVDQIKKIEIVRGPGSSIYGGYAELGVINIITKSAADINGIEIAGTFGQMPNIYGRKNINLNTGIEKEDWRFSLSGFLGYANRSEGNYGDFDGDTVIFKEGGAGIKTQNINIGAGYNNLNMRFIYDNYQTNYPVESSNIFKSMFFELKNDFKVNSKLSIIPKINIKNSIPYFEEGYYQNTSITRHTENMMVKYLPNDNVDIIGGIEFYQDFGHMLENTDSSVFSNGSNKINYNNLSFYMQGMFKTRFANITLGGRFENNSQFGSSFAPRIGLTKAWDKLHFKLLVSRAFRAPGIMNIEYSSSIKPEKTWVNELELGYKINDNMFISANLFRISVKDPIIYYFDGNDNYKNEGKTGTMGTEIEYRCKYIWGNITANYSYFASNSLNDVPNYEVPEHKNYLLGAPVHKFTLQSSFHLTKKLTFSPSLIYIGERYAHTDTTGINDITEINSAFLVNAWFRYENLFIKGLDAAIGVYDLLDQKPAFIQAYNSSIPYYPGSSRELLIKLTYKFGFR